jgi:hypothetical protein
MITRGISRSVSRYLNPGKAHFDTVPTAAKARIVIVRHGQGASRACRAVCATRAASTNSPAEPR